MPNATVAGLRGGGGAPLCPGFPDYPRVMNALTGPCGVLVGGDLGTWIGSIGTAAAFVLAAIAYLRSVRDKETAQARLMSAWVQGAPTQLKANHTYSDRGGPTLVDLRTGKEHRVGLRAGGQVLVPADMYSLEWKVENASDEMFSDICCSVVDPDGQLVQDIGKFMNLPPSHQLVGFVRIPVSNVQVPTAELQVEASFQDATGQSWTRTTRGVLERASD